jgi:hypothetical protein
VRSGWGSGAQSIVLTDAVIGPGAVIEQAILDKKSRISEQRAGAARPGIEPLIPWSASTALSYLAWWWSGAVIGPDVIEFGLQLADCAGVFIQTRSCLGEIQRHLAFCCIPPACPGRMGSATCTQAQRWIEFWRQQAARYGKFYRLAHRLPISPYQVFLGLAGNPYLVSPQSLFHDGLLSMEI